MAGRGTGYPIWFRCPIERRQLNDASFNRGRAYVGQHRKVRTGRTKAAPSRSKGHARKADRSWEYRCSCGHTGWSCHIDITRTPIEGNPNP